MAIEIAPRIIIDEKIRFGKPVIKGTRVDVQTVVGHLAAGSSIEEVMEAYGIERDDVAHVGRNCRWLAASGHEARVRRTAQQAIQLVELAALALPPHPHALCGVPQSPAMQQQESFARRRRPILAIQSSDALDRRVEQHVVASDPFVMEAWSKIVDPERSIRFVSDGNLNLCRALGLVTHEQELFLGDRSERYMLVVQNGVIEALRVETKITDYSCTRPDAFVVEGV